jgi:asparagine synthase (glutamine-hydrolysing)
VLRKFAEKRLPREIIERPKQGFPVPANKWLQEEKVLRWALDCLTGRGSRVKSMLNPSAMATQLSLASRGNFDAANKTWLLLVFEIWLRQYDVALEDAAVPEPHSAISILPN